MNTRGASRIAGGIALAAVLSVVAIVVWSMLNQSDPAPPSAPLAGGPSLGELTGYVGRVDLKARTVEVTENLVGLSPVMMAVTDDTSIMVRDQRAGLGDLTKDLPVRAFYEVRNDVKYVTSIKVIAADAQAKVPSPTPADARHPVAAQPPTETRPVAPPAVASAPAVARPVPPGMTDRVSASFKTAASPAPTPSRAPAPTAEAASPPSPPASAARPADTDAPDGSAAIDWLLNESRRR